MKKKSLWHYLTIGAKIILEFFEEFVFDHLRLSSRIEYIFDAINRKNKDVHTFSSYHFEDQVSHSSNLYRYADHINPLILIQGPISGSSLFELKAVRHYLFLNPQQKIIISTWDDKNSRLLEDTLAKHKNVKFHYNALPEEPGPVNINMQITNTRNGLLEALTDGHQFVAKVRTDQCMMHPRALDNLASIYRLHNSTDTSKIVVNSLNTFLFRPYGASDMFQYGRTEQMLLYWSSPIDSRRRDDYDLDIEGATLRNIAKRKFSETYLGINFLETIGSEPDFTLSQSLKFISDYFVVVDNPVTNLIWNKYTNRSNRWPHSSKPIPYQEIDYSLWIALSSQKLNLDHLDYLLDKPVRNREFSNE